MELLQHTDVLLGMHGAGWTNGMFIKHGAVAMQVCVCVCVFDGCAQVACKQRHAICCHCWSAVLAAAAAAVVQRLHGSCFPHITCCCALRSLSGSRSASLPSRSGLPCLGRCVLAAVPGLDLLACPPILPCLPVLALPSQMYPYGWRLPDNTTIRGYNYREIVLASECKYFEW